MSNPNSRKKRVIIAGGGIAGLTLGVMILTHAKEFYDVVIFEKSKLELNFRKRSGFAMALTTNSLRILAGLGFDLVAEGIAMPINRIIVHHDEEPEKAFAHANNIFEDPNTIQWVERGPLQHLLIERFEHLKGVIVFETSVEDINISPNGGLIAVLSHESSCVGDYIVGADGFNSNVRKYLYTAHPPKKVPSRCPLNELGPHNFLKPLSSLYNVLTRAKKPEVWEASPLPWTALYGITIPLPQHLLTGGETGEKALGTMHWYLRGSSGCYSTCSLPGGRVFWVCYESEPVSKGCYFTSKQAEDARRRYHGAPYCSAIPKENGEISAEDSTKKTSFQEITSRSEKIKKVRLYHTMFYEISNPTKNIVLIGDAAHPMSTFRGQGAGIGIEESVVLCNGLLRSAWQAKKPQLNDPSAEIVGIGYFEKLRKQRSEKITNSGWYFGFAVMGDWWISRFIRDKLLRVALRAPTPNQLKKERGKPKAGRIHEAGVKMLEEKESPNWLFRYKVNIEFDEEKYWKEYWKEYEKSQKARLDTRN